MSGVQAGLCSACGAAVGADRVCSVCSSPDDVVARAKAAMDGGWWSPADLSQLVSEVERLREFADRARSLAAGKAISARALGQSEVERGWLDLMAIGERLGVLG